MLKFLLHFSLAFVIVAVNAWAQERVRFPISASSKTLGYSPLWVASRLGFWNKQGLDTVVVAGEFDPARQRNQVADFLVRKVAKDHGTRGQVEGNLAGHKRVAILDDVITAGTAVREVLDIVRAAGATPAGVLVALDREEVAPKSKISAVAQLQNELGVPIRSIVTLTDLIDHLEEDQDYAEHLPAVRAYRNRYGVPLEA